MNPLQLIGVVVLALLFIAAFTLWLGQRFKSQALENENSTLMDRICVLHSENTKLHADVTKLQGEKVSWAGERAALVATNHGMARHNRATEVAAHWQNLRLQVVERQLAGKPLDPELEAAAIDCKNVTLPSSGYLSLTAPEKPWGERTEEEKLKILGYIVFVRTQERNRGFYLVARDDRGWLFTAQNGNETIRPDSAREVTTQMAPVYWNSPVNKPALITNE